MLGNPTRESAGDSAHRLIVLLRTVGRRLYRGLERARQRRALAALPDAMLKDLGLTRRDVASEIGKPFWRG